jgi:DnaJ family protein A protein 2
MMFVQSLYSKTDANGQRASYDQYGLDGAPRGGFPGGAPDMDDIFASMFGGGGGFGMHFDDGPFGSFDSAGPSRKPQRAANTDVAYEINLEDVYKGKRVVMNLERDRVCGGCKGSGGRNGVKASVCASCKGKGAVIQDRHVGCTSILSRG